MLRKLVIWRGNDKVESVYRRHGRHEAAWPAGPIWASIGGDSSPPSRVCLREVLDFLDDAGLIGEALVWVGVGVDIADAARRAGVSRQQIYRVRAQLRARFGLNSGSWGGRP